MVVGLCGKTLFFTGHGNIMPLLGKDSEECVMSQIASIGYLDKDLSTCRVKMTLLFGVFTSFELFHHIVKVTSAKFVTDGRAKSNLEVSEIGPAFFVFIVISTLIVLEER